MFNLLKSPMHIGKLTIPNRVVMPAMGVSIAKPEGGVTDDIIAFYEARANGSTGLIISEVTRITDGAGISEPCQLAAYRASDVLELQRLVDVIHQYDTKFFVQLQHPGREASFTITGEQSVAPSAVANPMGGAVPRALTTNECQELVAKFVKAASFVQMSGADGVELHGAHGYLINEFLSPAMNFRTDVYGGNFENRMRFVTEIISGIRDSCGFDFPISVRINTEEGFGLKDGIDLKESVKIAQALEKAGVDAINVSCYRDGVIDPGTYEQGWKKYMSKPIKDAVEIPVIAVANVKEPAVAEALLKEEAMDFVGVGRAQLADPEWTKKALFGTEDEIRTCIGCLVCFGELAKLHRVKCAVNPITCREREYSNPRQNGNGRKVAIIGGGPGGIEAALTLKERGFLPSIFDEKERLGGSLGSISKGLIKKYVDALICQVERAGIDLRLGQPVDIKSVQEMKPVGVFLALDTKSGKKEVDAYKEAFDVVRIIGENKGNSILDATQEAHGKAFVFDV
ncbi:MAG TPA: NADH:flavin oxidoreductase [Thermotogota bacterium]|mgnify:CR=1 FL=1|nr:NADH:flavin oxidoreductase [Thermotogota bacterium]HRW34668.1 NADH:flavin oxidoreductase [Thermotogota bacterium]